MIEQNLMHQKKYAPDILGEIKDVLDEREERRDLLPKNELNYDNAYLDNNMVERMKRYISLSRRNSLFSRSSLLCIILKF